MPERRRLITLSLLLKPSFYIRDQGKYVEREDKVGDMKNFPS